MWPPLDLAGRGSLDNVQGGLELLGEHPVVFARSTSRPWTMAAVFGVDDNNEHCAALSATTLTTTQSCLTLATSTGKPAVGRDCHPLRR